MIRRIVLLGLSALVPSALAAQNFDTVTIHSVQLRGGVYVLYGAGGNMGLSVGDDATFLVDDQFAPLTPKIVAAIGAITPKPVKFVINTHWHFDHVGGNENLGKAGVLIVAHDNVRRRMATDQFIEFLKRAQPASPSGALPVVTFDDSITFHLNGDDAVAFHVPPAHTDGDVIVHFTKANVIHMGDTFITGRYPFVDLSSGGNVNGFVTAADRALTVCNDDTKVIPGHGTLSDCQGLRAWRDMIATIRERVRVAMRDGKSLEAIKAAKLTADFDATHKGGSVNSDQFVEFIYRSLGGK